MTTQGDNPKSMSVCTDRVYGLGWELPLNLFKEGINAVGTLREGPWQPYLLPSKMKALNSAQSWARYGIESQAW